MTTEDIPERLIPPRAWIPSAVTAANIACGFLAMLLAATARFDAAVYVLVVAIYLDMFDGRLARILNATSDFGKQLDSFSDALSFGTAPAFLIYKAQLEALGPPGVVVVLLFVFAGIYRLARFNLLSDSHSKARRTMGIPIPIGAGYLMAAVMMRDQLPVTASALVVLVIAFGMVSRWRLPDLKGRGLVSALMLVGMFSYLAVIAWPNWYTVIWWNLWNVVILSAARREDQGDLRTVDA